MESFHSSDVDESCQSLIKKLEVLHHSDEEEKEFVKDIPGLILQIFGFDSDRGGSWIVESSKDLPTCRSLKKLLDPESPLFALMIKYSDHNRGTIKYHLFPQDHLSLSSLAISGSKRMKINRAFPYYSDTLTQENDDGMIRLDLFEYFLFLFAEFIVVKNYRFVISYPRKQVVSDKVFINPITYMKNWVNESRKTNLQKLLESHKQYEDPFRTILQMYLDFFFPMNKDDEPVLEGGNRSPSRWRKSGKGRKDRYRRKQHQNRYFHELRMRFLHIFTDFLLCNWSVDGRVTFSQSILDRSEGILGSTIVLVKHFLCNPSLKKRANFILRGFGTGGGSGGGNRTPFTPRRSPNRFSLSSNSSSSLPSPLTFPLEFLRVHLYQFLHVMFTAFPRKGTRKGMPLVGVVALWMEYAQPWRVFDDSDFDRWVPYIVCNWVFYSSIFIEFLSYVGESIGEASTRDIMSIKEVLEFFSEDSVIGLIRYVDEFLEKSKRGEDRFSGNSNDSFGGNYIGNLRSRGLRYIVMESDMLTNHLNECFGSSNHYRPVLSSENQKIANNLFRQCRGMDVPVSRPSRDGQSPLKRIFGGRAGGKRKLGDPRKGMSMIAEYLKKIFNLKDFDADEEEEERSFDGKKLDFTTPKKKRMKKKEEEEERKNGRGIGINKQQQRRREQKKKEIAAAGTGRGWDSGPLRYNHNNELTNTGKRELRAGKKVCSNMDVKVLGDPLMLPIRPSEFRVLVPPLQIVSKKLDKWARKNNYIPIKNTYIRINRINLRFLALKKLIAYLTVFGVIFYWIFFW